jgi:hypothetical protein
MIFSSKILIGVSPLYPKLHFAHLMNRRLYVKKTKKEEPFLKIKCRIVDFDPFCRRQTLSHFSVSKDINLFEICIWKQRETRESFVRRLTTCSEVKQSHYRPGQALSAPRVWSSHISRQSAHEGDKVVSHTHRPPLPARNYSLYSFLLETESTPGP